MKLYQSSFRLGDRPERWLAMLPARAPIAVICNAIDSEEPVLREEKVLAEHRWLVDLNSPGHPETELIEQVRDLYDRTGVPYVPLSDGQALVIDGTSRELV